MGESDKRLLVLICKDPELGFHEFSTFRIPQSSRKNEREFHEIQMPKGKEAARKYGKKYTFSIKEGDDELR